MCIVECGKCGAESDGDSGKVGAKLWKKMDSTRRVVSCVWQPEIRQWDFCFRFKIGSSCYKHLSNNARCLLNNASLLVVHTCADIHASLHTWCMYMHTHPYSSSSRIHLCSLQSHMYTYVLYVDENTIFTHIFCERVEDCFYTIDCLLFNLLAMTVWVLIEWMNNSTTEINPHSKAIPARALLIVFLLFCLLCYQIPTMSQSVGTRVIQTKRTLENSQIHIHQSLSKKPGSKTLHVNLKGGEKLPKSIQ